MLEYAFMQRALLAAVLVGVVCGVLGFFVVLRRLAFVGMGISHSALGGVALGLLLGVDPLLAGGVFAVGVAVAIAFATARTRLTEDAVIGVLLSGAMAVGLVLMSLRRGGSGDLFGYLFGNVLTVSGPDLWLLAGAGAAVLLLLALRFGDLLFVAFDPEAARAYGHPVLLLDTLLLVLLAVTVVIGTRLVGLLLVQALLVVPAATAALWGANFRSQLVLGAALGAGSGVLGLALAYQLDLAAGASIALVAVAGFGGSLALRRAPA
ncbi:MAG: metal ABC transporter permease [Myxococcota bacterium]